MYDYVCKIKDKKERNYDKKDLSFTFLYMTFKKSKIHDQRRKERLKRKWTPYFIIFSFRSHSFGFEETKAKCNESNSNVFENEQYMKPLLS